MKERSIIIIGAGIAGLAAGCYGQMNGFKTQVFELHDLPGGLCTAWERDGYTFDGCIHYLYGSAPGMPFHQLWRELGAIHNRPVINHTEFMRVIDPDGRALVAYTDPDRWEAHIQALSPADAHLARELADGVRQFMDFDMSLLVQKPRAQMKPRDWTNLAYQMTPHVDDLARWGMVDAQSYARRFRDPFLRRAIAQVFAWPEIPMMAALSLLAYMHQGNAGFPAGGSLEFARAVERRYLELGGQVHYKTQVEKVLVEDDTAVGVRLYNDEEVRADYIICASDGHGAIFDLLDGKYVSKSLHHLYTDPSMPVLSQVQVSYGVRRDLKDEPHWATYLLDQPLTIAGEERSEIGVKHYCFDPRMAPPGCSSIVVMLRSHYHYWQRIYGRKLYDTEQNQVADQVLDILEKIYPGIKADVEVIDVATPLSYERYTGSWMGSTTGWLLTNRTMRMMLTGMRKTLPGLRNFYMAGQWVEPGGSLPLAASSGRNAVYTICHKEKQPFLACEPAP